MYHSGDPADYFYIIYSGSAAVLKNHKPLRSLTEGMGFGELAFFNTGGRCALRHAPSFSILTRHLCAALRTCSAPSRAACC